jgi:hypothetical protein
MRSFEAAFVCLLCLLSSASAKTIEILEDDLELDYGDLSYDAGSGRTFGNTTFNSTYALIGIAFLSAVLVSVGVFLYFYELSTGVITKRRTGFGGGDYEYYDYSGSYR